MQHAGWALADLNAALLEDGRTHIGMLMNAVSLQCVRVVEALLAAGHADPAAWESDVLLLAVRRGNASIVRALLLDGRADPATRNSVVLRDAAWSGNVGVLLALLADGRADPGVVKLTTCAARVRLLIRAVLRWRRRATWLRAIHMHGKRVCAPQP
jgi:hypothetical protein